MRARPPATAVQSEPRAFCAIADQMFRCPMGLQIASLVLYQASTEVQFSLDISIDFFSRMLQPFRSNMAFSAHRNEKSNNSVRFRKACFQSSEFLSFIGYASTCVVLLNKILNHNEWLIG